MAKNSAGKTSALTDQQRAALEAKGLSVALSAGAGCGKTFVLTERFIRALQPRSSADRPGERLASIIAITFTERATREMRQRIRRAVEKRLRDCPEPEAEYWWALLRELESAQIDTIHAFCAALLRRHAVEAGLDPRFEVLDAAQSALWRSEVLKTVLENTLRQADEATLDLFARYDFYGVHERVHLLAQSLGREPVADWFDDPSEAVDRLLMRWREFFEKIVWPAECRRIGRSSTVEQMRQWIAQPPSDHPKVQKKLGLLSVLCGDDLSKIPPDRWLELRETAKVQDVRRKEFASDWDYQEFKETLSEFRDLVDRLLEVCFDIQAARSVAIDGLALLRIAHQVAEEYRKLKESQGVLDFDDLLVRARDLLTSNSELRHRLSQRVRLLLVDEFQDTDSVQVELVRALCGDELTKGKLFFVGDYKQSIYRFRGAQPEVFRGLSSEMPSEGRLPLSVNFRSQAPIIEFVNVLFADAMQAYEPLTASRNALADGPLVEFLWAAADAETKALPTDAAAHNGRTTDGADADRIANASAVGKETKEDARRREADWIARRINEMIEQGRPLVGERGVDRSWLARAPRYKDMVILFRSLSEVAIYERALRQWNVPYYLVGGKAFYSQEEIFDLTNLLRAIDDPADDAALLGALRSPIFNLYDETLVALKLGRPSLNDALFEIASTWTSDLRRTAGPAEAISDCQKQAVVRAAAVLGELRAMKDRVPVAVLVREALARTGFDAALTADFLGERKLANLYKLIDMAAANDAKGLFALRDFIVQLSEMVAAQTEEAPAATEAEQADVVRLMSIHQSKGLEFPIVFIADLGWSGGGRRSSAFYSPDLGPMIAPPTDAAETASGLRLYKRMEAIEDEAESLRLLYVAATRAADYLILSHGWLKKEKLAGKHKSPWICLLAERFDLSDGRIKQSSNHYRRLVVVRSDRPEPNTKPAAADPRPALIDLAEKARSLAQSHAIPETALPISPQREYCRRFSFSRLSASWIEPATQPADEDDKAPAIESAEEFSASKLDVRTADEAVIEEASVLGSWAHNVLARIEPHDFTRREAYSDWIVRLLPNEFDSGDHDDLELLGTIEEMMARFAVSARAKELAAAQSLHREIEFILPWRPAGAAAKHSRVGPIARYAHGFIDCLYQDGNGRWCLIDYKTNRIGPHNRQSLLEKYRPQLRLYALAVESALGQPPDDLILHFLRTGEEHRFPWTASDREEARREIEGSLLRLVGIA